MSRLHPQPGFFCTHLFNFTKCSYQNHSLLAVILYCIRHREPEPQPEPWNMIPPHTKPIPQNAPARSRNRTGAMLLWWMASFFSCKKRTKRTLNKNPRQDVSCRGFLIGISSVPSLQRRNKGRVTPWLSPHPGGPADPRHPAYTGYPGHGHTCRSRGGSCRGLPPTADGRGRGG